MVLRDLAYMTLDALKKMVASFLCRVKPDITIYERKGEEYVALNFVKIKRYMKKHGLDCLEL